MTADIPQNNEVFDKWIGSNGLPLADASQSQTTFVMPAKAVTVTVAFKEEPVNSPVTDYSITVTGGTSDKVKAKQGETVTVTATVPDEKVFDKWTSSNGITFANEKSATTTFTMPARNVELMATFKNKSSSSSDRSGGGGSSRSKPAISISTKKDDGSGSSQKGGTVTVRSDNKTVTIQPKRRYCNCQKRQQNRYDPAKRRV